MIADGADASGTTTGQMNTAELAALIGTMANIKAKVNSLEAEVIALRLDNQEIRKSRCTCKCSTTTSATVVSDQPAGEPTSVPPEQLQGPAVRDPSDGSSTDDSEGDTGDANEFQMSRRQRKKMNKKKKQAQRQESTPAVASVGHTMPRQHPHRLLPDLIRSMYMWAKSMLPVLRMTFLNS